MLSQAPSAQLKGEETAPHRIFDAVCGGTGGQVEKMVVRTRRLRLEQRNRRARRSRTPHDRGGPPTWSAGAHAARARLCQSRHRSEGARHFFTGKRSHIVDCARPAVSLSAATYASTSSYQATGSRMAHVYPTCALARPQRLPPPSGCASRSPKHVPCHASMRSSGTLVCLPVRV